MTKSKSRKPQFNHIWVDWLATNIYWVVCSAKRYVELVSKTFHLEIPLTDMYSGRCQLFEQGADSRILVIWVDRKDVPNLVHEIAHCLYYIFESKGITPDGDKGETFAYMQAHLVRTIMAKW